MALGIAPSRLDGCEPERVTEYEYDDAGRLVRSVTVTEPEWSEQDRAEVLALRIITDGECSCGCGHQAAETTEDESTSTAQFVARQLGTCRARMALIEAQSKASKERGDFYGPARLWTVDLIK